MRSWSLLDLTQSRCNTGPRSLLLTRVAVIIDLHTHSFPKSDDSFLSPEDLIGEAKRVGLDGICLTDHDGFWNPQEIAALSKKFNFPLFPGCEVTTEEGHLLVFGLEKYIFGMHRATFVRGLVDEVGGAIVVAHPYRRRFMETQAADITSYTAMIEQACESQVFSMVDSVEVLNGRGSTSENAFSAEIAKRFDLRATGSSDAHNIKDIGTFATAFERDIPDLKTLIKELREGSYQPLALEKRRAPTVTEGQLQNI